MFTFARRPRTSILNYNMIKVEYPKEKNGKNKKKVGNNNLEM